MESFEKLLPKQTEAQRLRETILKEGFNDF